MGSFSYGTPDQVPCCRQFQFSPIFKFFHSLKTEQPSERIELPLSSNIALRFEDAEHKETCLPDLSGQM
jgi:hypothetical protein